mgnify:CR=1 FL=1
MWRRRRCREHAHPHANSYPDAHSDPNTYAYAHSNPNTYAYAHSDPYADEFPDVGILSLRRAAISWRNYGMAK